MPVRLMLYDLDGTLVDSKEDLAHAVNRTLTDLGLPTRPHAELFTFVGNGVRMLLKRAVDGHDSAGLDDAIEIFRAHYLAHLTDHSTLYPGVEHVIATCADRHQAIVTNKPTIYTQGVVKNLGLAAAMDLVLSGDSTPHLKPHPAIVQAALTHFGVAPEQALMVGDGVPDIEAARAAGVPCVVLTCGLGNREAIEAARPDYLVDRIQDVLPILERLDAGEARP